MRLATLSLVLLAASCSKSAPVGKPAPVASDVATILDAPDRLEILALEPYHGRRGGASDFDAGLFHGHQVLGSALLPDAETRRDLIKLVYQGLHDSHDMKARCFNPRHGISATRDGRTVELVICYECSQVDIHGPGAQEAQLDTSPKVEPEISRLFRSAGVTVQPRPPL